MGPLTPLFIVEPGNAIAQFILFQSQDADLLIKDFAVFTQA
jgi:hypothetical protein